MALGKLLDYSSARPDLAQVKAAGYSAIYRYVSEDHDSWKRLTPSERDSILSHGLDIGLHGEDEADAASKGYSRGLQQGKNWLAYAKNTLHVPQGMTIVAAIDYNTMAVHGAWYPKVVDDYLRGVNDGFAGYLNLGVYGPYGVISGAYTAGRGTACYVMTNAWGSDTPPWFCHLHQHGGDSRFPGCDYNDVLRIPHGTWNQTLGGVTDDMTPEEHDMLNDLHNWLSGGTGAGQTNEGGTIAATLSTVQTVVNKLNSLAGAVANVPTVPEIIAGMPHIPTPQEIAETVVPAVIDALPGSATGGITKTETATAIAAAAAALGA